MLELKTHTHYYTHNRACLESTKERDEVIIKRGKLTTIIFLGMERLMANLLDTGRLKGEMAS